MADSRLLSIEVAAARLGVSPRSLADRRYRCRLNLPGVKVGRRLLFAEVEVDRIVREGRERLPGERR